MLSDERAKGRIRASAERIAALEQTNFETLNELTKNGTRERVPVAV